VKRIARVGRVRMATAAHGHLARWPIVRRNTAEAQPSRLEVSFRRIAVSE
jgi:hypothetical protein